MATMKKAFSRTALAERLERYRSGRWQWTIVSERAMSATLLSAVQLRRSLGSDARRRIVKAAIGELFKLSEITPDAVLEAVNAEEVRYLRQPLAPYVLVTNLSAKVMTRLPVTRLAGATVTVASSLPKTFEQARRSLERQPTIGTAEAIPASAWARVRLKARSDGEAVDLAIERLDALRGIWTILLTVGMEKIQLGGMPSPLGPLAIGPKFSLHYPRGQARADHMWARPGFVAPSSLETNLVHHEVVTRFSRFRGKLRRLPYQDRLLDSLTRYAVALDGVDFHASAMRLWAILENLTNTTHRRTDDLIRRLCFLYTEPDSAKLTLQHLRLFRNETVHLGEDRADAKAVLQQLKHIVDDVIRFHIDRGQRFSGMEEVGAFLELPRSRKLMRHALEYHRL